MVDLVLAVSAGPFPGAAVVVLASLRLPCIPDVRGLLYGIAEGLFTVVAWDG